MTAQDHNKVLGILNLVYGGTHAFGMLIAAVYFAVFWKLMGNFPPPPPGGGDPFPPEFFSFFITVMALMMIVFTLLFAVPPLIAGYGLLKRRAWARKAAIAASILSAVGFPLGTALSVYSFWFLFGQGDALYKNGGKATVSYLREATPAAPFAGWNESDQAAKNREPLYVPPTQPPDWRG